MTMEVPPDVLHGALCEHKPRPFINMQFLVLCAAFLFALSCSPQRRWVRRFIARLPDGKKKAEEYAAAGMFHEAAETAAQAKDSDMLSTIQSMVGAASPLGVAVSQIKERLQVRPV
jgi:hypothetical protein